MEAHLITRIGSYSLHPKPSRADGSRNLWWVALLTFGEGWHNNHPAYPKVAKAGWKWWQMNVTWWTIQSLELLSLAKKVVMPPLQAEAFKEPRPLMPHRCLSLKEI